MALTRIISEIIQDNTIENSDISASFSTSISGSRDAASISGSRDAASISGSLGANAGVIRTLSAVTVSGSRDAASISGSFGNQRVGTTDDVKFANITGSNDISASGNLSITRNVDIDGTSNLAGDVTLQSDLSVVDINATNITGSEVSASTALFTTTTIDKIGGAINFNNENMTNVDIDSGNIDTVTFGSTVQSMISGSRDVASISGSRDATSISGSLGANAGVIRTLSAVTVSGSRDAASISGSFGNQRVGTTDDVKFANITGSNDISASGNLSITGNVDVDGTSNFAGDVTLQNDLVVTGRLTAEEIHTTFISSSITQATGSNLFGDATSDSHQFTGSIDVSGSFTVRDGDMVVSDTLTATNIGAFTATGAIDFDNQNMTNVDIDSGVITGITDLVVADGGTGVSTLTDGGVLLGSGTSAITAMAVLTDGQMIVGDGTTDPVAESGATLRTSIGVGTGDTPVFTELELSGGGLVMGNGQNAAIEVDATAHNAAGKAMAISAGATTAGTTNNIAGGAVTVSGGQGKGTGAGGDILFKVSKAAAGAASSLNALTTALTISGEDGSAEFTGQVICEGFVSNYREVTSNYTAGVNDYLIIASGSGTTVSLPAPSSDNGGTVYRIKRVDGSNSITIGRASGSGNIDGAATYTLDANYMMIEVMSDETNWLITGAYEVPE